MAEISKDSNICSWDIETYFPCFIISAEDNQGPFDYITCDKVDAVVVEDFLTNLGKYDFHTTYNGKGFDIKVLAWIVGEYKKNGRRYIPVYDVAEQAQLYIKENNEHKNKLTGHSRVWTADYKIIDKVRKNHFDIMIYTGGHSLKYWELARGWSIKESSIPFDVKEMSRQDVMECAKYCRHDVHSTWKLTHEKNCIEKIMGRQWVFDNCKHKYNMDITDAELAENYVYDLDDNLFDYGTEEGDVTEEDTYDLIQWDEFKVPTDVRQALMNIALKKWTGFVWNGKELHEVGHLQSQIEIKEHGINEWTAFVKSGRLEKENWVTFGAGGAHYCRPGRNELAKINDVKSLYPHIVWGKLGLKTKKALERYVQCLLKRVDLKALKKTNPELYSKAMDLGLKLILNSLSGKFRMKGAKAYAPNHGLAMCIIGQLLIVEATVAACGMDENGKVDLSRCIEINTDSFAVEGDTEIARAREYCKDKKHGYFEFEEDDFFLSYWKDVNHYFVLDREMKVKEDHGFQDLDTEIIKKSIIHNTIKDKDARPELADSDKIGDWLVKYNKPAGSTNATIDGKPMEFKYYAFLWVTKDCPDAHEIRLNSQNVDSLGIIYPRRGVVCMGGTEEAEKYKQYIDKEQYLEDLKRQLVTWNRPDMVIEKDIFGNIKRTRSVPGIATWEQLKTGNTPGSCSEDDLF